MNWIVRCREVWDSHRIDGERFRWLSSIQHELRARLAEREGQQAERATALARAQACYTRFGMTAQAARVTAALGDAA